VYNFKVKYKKPGELQHVDALSRSFKEENQIENEDRSILIIKTHEEFLHRASKATFDELKKKGYKEITMIQVRNVLSR
jgi:hypothetical protein